MCYELRVMTSGLAPLLVLVWALIGGAATSWDPLSSTVDPVAEDREELVLGYLTGSQRQEGNTVYARPGLTISGAISLAVDEVNQGLLAASPYQLSFVVAETYGEEEISIRQTASLWIQNVSALIGPQETCVHEGRMAAAFNLPMISYYCTDYETSDKKNFPTFARTKPPSTQISKSVASLLLEHNWTQVTFLYLRSVQDDFDKVAATIQSVLETAGVKINMVRWWNEPYHRGYSENPFPKLLQDTYRDTRIYVILGYYFEHIGLLSAMYEMNLLDNGEYWVVGVDLEQYNPGDPRKYFKGFLKNDEVPNASNMFSYYLGIAPSPPIGIEAFNLKVNEYLMKPPFEFPNPLVPLGGNKLFRAEAAYLYDAVVLYARAVLEVTEAGEDLRNGTAVINHIRGIHYKSVQGYMVYMDEYGDPEGNYTLIARKPYPGIPDQFGIFPVGIFALGQDVGSWPELRLSLDIDWGPRGKPPLAVPPCGFRGEICISHTMEIVGCIVGVMAFLLALVTLILYRNWRYEQELDSLLWKVDYKDIQLNDPEHNSSSSLGTKITRAIHPLIRTSQVSLSSNPDADFRYSSIYTPVGVYRGRVFAIKKVHKKSIDITRSMKKELKIMRDLRHDNLNAFIGACTDPPHICIVTEYCTRGSLKDILENEDVKLDNMFIASLVADIIRGLVYLHDSPLHWHGNLKASNCLVDSRWVVKLADFGLGEFKAGAEDYHHYLQHTFSLPHDDAVQCKCEGLLYRAPELLRLSTATPGIGSQKGDVYSFGIILFELNGRRGPFGDNTGLTTPEIIRKVIQLEPGCAPFRPPLEILENSFDFVRDCLKECWQENPDDRPDIKAIRTKLRPLRKGMKPNIFDNMIAMMEKYANNLEALALLYEMLPRYVAEQLKRGNKVEAESFDFVTIYFSDIVGFTAMSAESTPLQVVDFLNDLYTCFDSTIENYDVYKVETIGDAYMVVSGLPVRNGDNHAAEIASMSLHLLEAVKRFQIRHRPSDNLMLRIGIHSGPVCAGVVGLKMPRYCLFGDTVNTASRMESTGAALRIHCSSQCKALLDRLKGYRFAERGLVGMKGKGEVLTYWLLGEDAEWRQKRTDERRRRRSEQNARHHHFTHRKSLRNKTELNGCPPGPAVPRSSLKNRNSSSFGSPYSIRCNLSRCASLESPKKLRFASSQMLEFSSPYQKCSRDPLLEVITDSSPGKRKQSGLGVSSNPSGEFVCDSHLSASCPCIENIPPSPKLLPKLLNLQSIDLEKTASNSEPVLFTVSPVISNSNSLLLDPLLPAKDSYEHSTEELSEGMSLLHRMGEPLRTMQ
ncbi:hypothetical protein LSTR_LSTR000353 [Laodelphax striatellus]|uniref:Guanylate cyclase n=1 Tax=Laodelphax striatellus TaxID=195883 RepID=A0A482X3X1_LAOST|nr:hypothetical protein LSTR_LSTR000353 [Laodelphax striatellus]